MSCTLFLSSQSHHIAIYLSGYLFIVSVILFTHLSIHSFIAKI